MLSNACAKTILPMTLLVVTEESYIAPPFFRLYLRHILADRRYGSDPVVTVEDRFTRAICLDAVFFSSPFSSDAVEVFNILQRRQTPIPAAPQPLRSPLTRIFVHLLFSSTMRLVPLRSYSESPLSPPSFFHIYLVEVCLELFLSSLFLDVARRDRRDLTRPPQRAF